MLFSDVIGHTRLQTPLSQERQGTRLFCIKVFLNELLCEPLFQFLHCLICELVLKCNPPPFLLEGWPTHSQRARYTWFDRFNWFNWLFLFLSSLLYLPHPSSKCLHHIYTTQLGRFLEKVDFTPEVRDACQDLVSTAMGLYFELSANLLPTPAKSHYTFNLRDLNKVNEREHEHQTKTYFRNYPKILVVTPPSFPRL